MLPIISGVTLAFLIVLGVSAAYIIYHLFGDTPDQGENTEQIADYINRNIYDVRAELESKRVRVGNVSFENNTHFEENYIISHDPAPGEFRRWLGNDIPINFVVSKGRYSYLIEDLSVMDVRAIEIDLRRRGINVERVSRHDDYVPHGHIIATYPGPGIMLGAGDTLRIYSSLGQEIRRVLMPNVVGMSERDARHALVEAEIGLAAIVSEHSHTVAPGFIIDQSITAFSNVPRRSTRVTLTVSIGRPDS